MLHSLILCPNVDGFDICRSHTPNFFCSHYFHDKYFAFLQLKDQTLKIFVNYLYYKRYRKWTGIVVFFPLAAVLLPHRKSVIRSFASEQSTSALWELFFLMYIYAFFSSKNSLNIKLF